MAQLIDFEKEKKLKNANPENEIDLLSSINHSPITRGPIHRILQTLVNRKLSNKSNTSKSSFSTQYSYMKNRDSLQNEDLSQISDFELDEDGESSFHSSVNNSFLSANQIINISGELVEEEEIEEEKIEMKMKRQIKKPLINLNMYKL